MRTDAERIENTETCEKCDKHWKQDRDAFKRLKGKLYFMDRSAATLSNTLEQFKHYHIYYSLLHKMYVNWHFNAAEENEERCVRFKFNFIRLFLRVLLHIPITECIERKIRIRQTPMLPVKLTFEKLDWMLREFGNQILCVSKWTNNNRCKQRKSISESNALNLCWLRRRAW